MYIDPKGDFAPLSADEITARAGLDSELNSHIEAIAGATATLQLGSVPAVYRVSDSVFGASKFTVPKPAKPFVVVDGVVYINASMIKECTL